MVVSSKYVGYVGGVAVAVGVGAAIAAAGQGTAKLKRRTCTNGISSLSQPVPDAARSGCAAWMQKARAGALSDRPQAARATGS